MPPTIDPQLCTRCGLCAIKCGAFVLRQTEPGGTPEVARPENCIACCHCMAICPDQAITVTGFDYSQFSELVEGALTPEAFADFLKARRAVRHFEERPVEREALERVLEMATTAPMGIPPSPVEVTVLATRAEVARLADPLVADYEQFLQQMKNPIARFFIRRAIGADRWPEFEHHILSLIPEACRLYRQEGVDVFTWGAPVLMLFHADRRRLVPEVDCHIACTYAMLAAHALGLGTTIVGVIPPMVDRSREMRKRLGIPEQNMVVTSLIMGYPKCHFRRSIPRELKSVTWLTGDAVEGS